MNLKAIRVSSEALSPKQFLKLTKTERRNIEATKIVPPQLGQDEFGKILVNYKDPIYKVEYDK